MVQLVLIYCLISNGNACIERRPMLEDIDGISICMMAGPPNAAQFVSLHPTYRLARWRCEVGKRPEKAA